MTEPEEMQLGATIYVDPDTRTVHVGLYDGEQVLDLGDVDEFEAVIHQFVRVHATASELAAELEANPTGDLSAIVDRHLAALSAQFN